MAAEPAHTNEQLAQLKAEDKKPFEFEGKEYTKYEASQMMNKIEIRVKNLKDRANIAASAGDEDLRREVQYNINLLTNKYAKLADTTGLPTKMEKMKVAGFRKVGTDTNKIAFNVKPGKDINAKVDWNIVSSGIFEKKFQGISDVEVIDSIIVSRCKEILKNRDETFFEELFAIDAQTGKTLTYIKGKQKNSVQMTSKLQKLLTNSKENSIIIVHNHPNSSTFSTKDVSTMIKYKSIRQTIAIGHNGDVFNIGEIPRNESIIEEFRVSYTKHRNMWSDFTSREKAWDDVSKKWRFIYEKR